MPVIQPASLLVSPQAASSRAAAPARRTRRSGRGPVRCRRPRRGGLPRRCVRARASGPHQRSRSSDGRPRRPYPRGAPPSRRSRREPRVPGTHCGLRSPRSLLRLGEHRDPRVRLRLVPECAGHDLAWERPPSARCRVRGALPPAPASRGPDGSCAPEGPEGRELASGRQDRLRPHHRHVHRLPLLHHERVRAPAARSSASRAPSPTPRPADRARGSPAGDTGPGLPRLPAPRADSRWGRPRSVAAGPPRARGRDPPRGT